MNELQIFENKQFGKVRTVEENGKVLFCGSDVAKALGYKDTVNALKTHCKSDGVVIHHLIDAMGRKQNAKFINEGNLYRLITHSKLPEAERFEKWVFDDVLPTIRRSGLYATDELIANPDLAIAAFQALKTEREQRQLLQFECNRQKQIIGELKPKADYTDIILQSKSLVTITQIAKDYGMSGKVMNELLHKYGIQFKQSGQWLLYSKYHNNGFTHSETVSITRNDGRADTIMNTKWTQKGRLFIYNLLKANEILPVIEQNMTV
ncbi:MAG: phage antirepressor KilAC domain-containing protein [Clostridia bacterium]|nr:phage antirepressor KilAC domain-containing protein [Clostridia bacterium]